MAAPVQDWIGWQFPLHWRTGTVWSLPRQTGQAPLDDGAPSMGAALAYYKLY